MRYTLKDITDLFAKKSKLPQKKAEVFAKAFFKTIVEGLEQDSMTKVKNFGTFKIVAVSDRQSVDVNTGRPVLISGHNKVTFTPDEKFKSIVNRPFSQFETIILNEETDTEELERVNTPVLPEPVAKEEAPSSVSPTLQDTEKQAEETILHSEKTTDAQVLASEETFIDESQAAESAPEPSESASPVYAASIMQVQEKQKDVVQPTEEVKPTEEAQPTEEIKSTEEVSALTPGDIKEALDATTRSEDTEQAVSEKSSSGKSKWKIAAVVLGVLLLAGIISWVTNNGDNDTSDKPTTATATDNVQKTQTDSLASTVAQTDATEGITIGKNGEKLQLFDTNDSRDIVNNFEIVGDLEEYEYQFGDIVELIAKERYGNGYFMKYIYQHNNMKPYAHVSPGTKLKLPKLKRKQ